MRLPAFGTVIKKGGEIEEEKEKKIIEPITSVNKEQEMDVGSGFILTVRA
ncbi:MAG: hypothetical protein IBX41_00985 [Methanophagales archaeon]|nr:hypothetical protein [Methanophagales archaeon]